MSLCAGQTGTNPSLCLAKGILLHPELLAELMDGFGPSKAGEDPFDAVVGLIGMLNILTGNHQFSEPPNNETRLIEGWIFGLAVR